jgi:hypothetical protein
MPARSGLKDAHVTFTGPLDTKGDGTVVFQPVSASNLRLHGTSFALEFLSVGGKSYMRSETAKWTPSQTAIIDVGTWSAAKNVTFIGAENLSGAETWHVKGRDSQSNDFEVWIRQDNRYPLKYSVRTCAPVRDCEPPLGPGRNTYVMAFDRFNKGAAVILPHPADIAIPRNLGGKVGDRLALNDVTVTVAAVTSPQSIPALSRTHELSPPKPGNRFLVLEVLYENTSTNKIGYAYVDWHLTDSAGANYSSTASGGEPALQSGDIAPHRMARGLFSFEVPASASGFEAKMTRDYDSATIPLP